jgi:hemolysin activation/secretion protein
VDAVHRPDPQNHLYLGGLDGLRGYGNHLWLGDRRWMISLEERVTTQLNLLGILQLGFVIYADAAAIRRVDTGQWSRTYLDVGGGFRLGNLKSSFGGVFLVTVAIPLVKDPWTDRYQVVVGDLVRF